MDEQSIEAIVLLSAAWEQMQRSVVALKTQTASPGSPYSHQQQSL